MSLDTSQIVWNRTATEKIRSCHCLKGDVFRKQSDAGRWLCSRKHFSSRADNERIFFVISTFYCVRWMLGKCLFHFICTISCKLQLNQKYYTTNHIHLIDMTFQMKNRIIIKAFYPISSLAFHIMVMATGSNNDVHAGPAVYNGRARMFIDDILCSCWTAWTNADDD